MDMMDDTASESQDGLAPEFTGWTYYSDTPWIVPWRWAPGWLYSSDAASATEVVLVAESENIVRLFTDFFPNSINGVQMMVVVIIEVGALRQRENSGK